MGKEEDLRRLGHGSSRGVTPIKTLPKFNDTYRSPDPRETRKNQEIDYKLDEWRKTLQFQGDTFGGSVIINRGPQGGGGGTGTGSGPQGAQGFQGVAGPQGFQGVPGPLEVTRIHVWIAKRTDGKPGRGVVIDPYDGSTQEKFDRLMRSFPPYTTIHLSDEIFQTEGSIAGNIPLADQWRVKPGWHILGSGVGKTTLQLVNADQASSHYWILFNNTAVEGYVDNVVIDGLTLDCNLAGQPEDVLTGGFNISGSSIRVTNLRVINWGSRTTTGIEAFSVGSGGTPFLGDTFSYLVENVRMEAPAALDPLGGGTMMTFGVVSQLQWDNASITRSGSTATVNMGANRHSLEIGAWFNVRGATQAAYNGNFQVSDVVSEFIFQYQVVGLPATPATGDPEVEHHWDDGRGRGVMHGLIIRDCVLDCDPYIVGVHGITTFGVDGAIIESNTIIGVDNAIYMDEGFGESVIFRGNVLYRVQEGIYFGLAAGVIDTVIAENNLIELEPLLPNTGTFIPGVTVRFPGQVVHGMFFQGLRTAKPLAFRQLVVRNNIVRYAHQASGNVFEGRSFFAQGVESLQLTGNTIGMDGPNQMTAMDDVASVVAYNNRTPSGYIALLRRDSDSRKFFDPDIDADKIQKLALLGS